MAVTGPDFISLQVRDLERSAAFYERYLGLKRSDAGPPHAVVFGTKPIAFAVRDVTYREGKSLARTGNAARVMASQTAWPSACCAWAATPASPPLTATTPAATADAEAASNCVSGFAVSLAAGLPR